MAFIAREGNPRFAPKIFLMQFDSGVLEWIAVCPFGCNPKTQAKANALASQLNKITWRS